MYASNKDGILPHLPSCARAPRLPTAALALALHGQNALQGGGGDAQPLGDGDVVFHFLRDDMAADHQHTGAPEQVTANVDAVLVLLGYRVIEEQGQEQRGADGCIARLIDSPAIGCSSRPVGPMSSAI